MKIEDEIKQYKFVDNYQKAIINLHFTSNWYRDRMSHIFKNHNLHFQHFNILRILKGKHPESVTPGYIKEVMLDKGTDLTRIIDKLQKFGLIERYPCPTNRRKVFINLTDQGINLLMDLNKEVDLIYDEVRNNLSIDEAILLNDLLDKIRD